MEIASSARSGRAVAPRERARRLLPPPASIWWVAAAAAAFTLSELLFVVPRLGLSWDETVYVSQLGAHAPAAYFDAARARGIPLLVAPVTLLTPSVTVLHVYLALASGAGLFGALLVWRTLRPGWLLGLAGLAIGGLWVTEYYGPQAMPDLWVALGALAAVGFFLRASAAYQRDPLSPPAAAGLQNAGRQPGARSRRGSLAGLASCIAFAALVRPGDAAFLAACLAGAVILVRPWRRWPPLAAVVTGLAAGGAEWVIEAQTRFGGPLARLHAAGAEQGGLGLHLGAWAELRAVNGPTLCRPCLVGWRAPELTLWWLALPMLVTLGVWAARRTGNLRSSLLAAVCGLAVAVQYLFLIDYAAPRFLLPAYALLAIPVADGLGRLLAGIGPEWRPSVIMAVGLALALQLAAQHVVLSHEVRGTVRFHSDYGTIAADLRGLGVRPPCLIKGEQFIPIAYTAGCASVGSSASARRVAVLEYHAVRPPAFARHWHRHRLPGTRVLHLVAYLPARRGPRG